MPPKTRGDKISKKSKENVDDNCKSKFKTTGKVSKPARKPLADKTNSASDDNETFLPLRASKETVGKSQEKLLVKQRPRRDRRVPIRYVESSVLLNLSNSNNATAEAIESSAPTPVKKYPIVVISPLKLPKTTLDTSLTARRPKRICRLPSKFDNHSISPSKFVPVHPAYASTPKGQSKSAKITNKTVELKKVSPNKTPVSDNVVSSKIRKRRIVQSKVKANGKIKSPDTTKNNSPDTNNNAKKVLPRNKTKNTINKSPEVALRAISSTTKTIANKNCSFKILENTKKSLKRDVSNVDVYEFTYDPNEEPPPQKKKRKRPAKKREPKPKTVVFKNNYDRNLAKTLVALKNTVSSKSATPAHNTDTINKITDMAEAQTPQVGRINPTIHTQANYFAQVNPENISPPLKETSACNPDKSNVSEKNYKSVRVEDIALDFEQDNDADNINYSPVNSPNRPPSPIPQRKNNQNTPHAHNDDPLNLQDGFSFFDDQPVASSSMNVSVRNPAASPWRVEFGSLPIKWQVNTYVKPNMTPAFESSFLNFNDSKKKHVYTNLGSETNEAHDLPQIFEENSSKLKQTSIMSFIKEVVEKSAKKKKEKLTPIKANSLFEDLHGTALCNDFPITQKHVTPDKNDQNKISSSNDVSTPPNPDVISDLSKEKSESTNNSTSDKENNQKAVKKINKRKNDNDLTYFGFDDTENVDQENVSPVKKMDKRKLRSLKPRSRVVLQEINDLKGPTRANLPVAIKSKATQSSEMANKLFDDMKSATEPPVFPDKEVLQSTDTVNIMEVQINENSTDPESVHLFEDLEFVHHLKAHRKSYGKPKKAVTFRHNSMSDSNVPPGNAADQNESSDEDDLYDLTFKVPALEPKKTVKRKKTKKQKLSKKEEQEVEAWAAGFNSMCEDIEEFDLVVE